MAQPASVDLLPLLKKLSTDATSVTAAEVTDAITAISQAQCSTLQTGALLTAMHYTAIDMNSDIIAGAARAMRAAGLKIPGLLPLPAPKEKVGSYRGGLVDMVGTGGDGHDTYNVSTTAAVVAAGCGIRVCKHGSKASTSSSGSADLLSALGAHLPSITAPIISSIYASPDRVPRTNFAFVFAQLFHPAMARIAPIRRDLGCRTIFNVLGPLISPVDYSIAGGLESRVLGVSKPTLGPTYVEALRLLGVKKALVVCGEEHLDEVSPEGYTFCWRLHAHDDGDFTVHHFRVHPTRTFGLGTHKLVEVAGGRGPAENAEIFKALLNGQVQDGDAIKDFVLVNAAALLVAAGAAEGEEGLQEDGVIVGSLWTNAVEMARWAMDSGEAFGEWEKFVEISKQAQSPAN